MEMVAEKSRYQTGVESRLAFALGVGKTNPLYDIYVSHRWVNPSSPHGYKMDVPTHVIVSCIGQKGVPTPPGDKYAMQVGGPDPRVIELAERFGRTHYVWGKVRQGSYVMSTGQFAKFKAAVDQQISDQLPISKGWM